MNLAQLYVTPSTPHPQTRNKRKIKDEILTIPINSAKRKISLRSRIVFVVATGSAMIAG